MTVQLDLPLRSRYPDDIPKEVCDLFETLALDVAHRGFTRYSADAILHQIRWRHHIEYGDRDFKCNDHWTAPLARWFLAKHPSLDGFFQLRERRPNDD